MTRRQEMNLSQKVLMCPIGYHTLKTLWRISTSNWRKKIETQLIGQSSLFVVLDKVQLPEIEKLVLGNVTRTKTRPRR
jgi:hypothetical protein